MWNLYVSEELTIWHVVPLCQLETAWSFLNLNIKKCLWKVSIYSNSAWFSAVFAYPARELFLEIAFFRHMPTEPLKHELPTTSQSVSGWCVSFYLAHTLTNIRQDRQSMLIIHFIRQMSSPCFFYPSFFHFLTYFISFISLLTFCLLLYIFFPSLSVFLSLWNYWAVEWVCAMRNAWSNVITWCNCITVYTGLPWVNVWYVC